MSPKESHRGARRRRGPHPQAEQPRQGALPAHRHHQGRGAQLLRPGRAGDAAARWRTAPSTRVRWPHGVEEQSFFEKNIPGGTPSWVRTAEVPTTGSRGRVARNGDVLVFPIVDDLATLTWLVNLAALELHVHQWTVDARRASRAERQPARHRPRPGRAGRAARVLPGGAAGARRAGRARPRGRGGDQRQQGPAPLRRPPAAARPRRRPRRWPRRSPRSSPRSTPSW